MKYNILLLVLLFSSYHVIAKTPRVKNERFTYETIKLPEMSLPQTRTYSLYLETAADYAFVGLQYQNSMNIPGWTKMIDGHYDVHVEFFPINYHEPFIIERCEYVKDTAGRNIDSIFFYKNVYKARGMGSLEIINDKFETVYGHNLAELSLETTGREFRQRRAALHHRFREANELQAMLVRDFTQAFTHQVNNKLDNLLGVYPITKQSSLMIVRNKEHKEYGPMNKFWNAFVLVAHQVNAQSDLSKVEENLFHEIDYLKNIENKYAGNKKADRKIRYMAYRNLSEIYEMLEMPQKAIYYAQKIRSNDFREFNASYLIADAKRMQRLQDIHGMP